MIQRIFLASFVAALLMGATGRSAQASHDRARLAALGDQLRYQAQDLERELVRNFSRSRLFGEMMAASAQIRGGAIRVRDLSRHGRDAWRLYDEVQELEHRVAQLRYLVDQARYRAVRGWEPALRGCTLYLDHDLAAMDATVARMQRLVAMHRPRPVCPGGSYGAEYGYGVPYSGPYGHSGHGAYRPAHGSYGRGVRMDDEGMTIRAGGLSFRVNF